jgi:tRNA pseudouridine55 synthase
MPPECQTIQTLIPQAHGLLLVDKPAGITSAKCLGRIKKELGQKKIGHAGTLDPMAKGLLIALLGQGTKLAPYITSGTKTYKGELRVGFETDTYDKEGTIIEHYPWEHITPDNIQSEIQGWLSLKEQNVPPYAAAKYQGQPFYALQRAGKPVPKRTKPIHIDVVDILRIELPFVTFRVRCSHGTYIRSLAHSLGKRLGCGAVLMDLVREKSDPFSLDQAFSLERLLQQPEFFEQRVIPLHDSLPQWPYITLNNKQVTQVRNGIRLMTEETGSPVFHNQSSRALFVSPDGTAVALVEAKPQQDEGMFWNILRVL